MTWHLIEGEAGCEFAVRNRCVAVVVDALRASATAAMLLDAGATEILVVRELDDAYAARKEWPDALLFGERGGLPPEDFDFGNSPQTVSSAKGRRVVFTTTTGAGRLISAWGAVAAYMGSTVNASAAARTAAAHGLDVVVIPAGLATDPNWPAQEDWVAATAVATVAGANIGEGRPLYEQWCSRIQHEGIPALFSSAPHAKKLYRIGLDSDVAYCARMDLTSKVPVAVSRVALGVILRSAAPTQGR